MIQLDSDLPRLVFVFVATVIEWNRTLVMILMGILWTMGMEVARTELLPVQDRKSLLRLRNIETLALATAKQMEVTRDPAKHGREDIWVEHTGAHQLLTKLAATAIQVNKDRTHDELPELRVPLCVPEDLVDQSWAEDCSVIEETVLDGVDSAIHKMLNLVLLAKAIQIDKGHLMSIEASAEVVLNLFNLTFGGHGADRELRGRLCDGT